MAEESLKNSFKKGLATLAALSLISSKRIYGYELVQSMARLSSGNFTMRETALYPVLYRLEQQGMIQGERVYENSKRPRVYYQLTEKGQHYLANIRAEYDSINGGLQAILAHTDKGEGENG